MSGGGHSVGRVLGRVFRSPWTVAALIVATLVLGYWGFAEIEGDNSGASDDAYRTIQLLYVNASVPAQGTPWQLDIARFLAPLVIPYIALVALFAAISGRAGRIRMALFGRGHLLIVGVGARGSALARALRDKRRIVLFEMDEGNGAAASLRREGATVLFGDARDERALRASRPWAASEIVLLTGDDSVNLDVLAVLRTLMKPGEPVSTHVAIEGVELWSELHRLPLEDADAQRRTEFVNIPDRVARILGKHAFRSAPPSSAGRRILVHGEEPELSRLVVQLLRSASIGVDPAFELSGGGASAAAEALDSIDPWVFDRATVGTSLDLEPTDSFVCGLPEAEALAAAVAIQRRHPGDSPVYVSVPDARTGETLRTIGLDLERLELIPTESEVVGEALLQASAFEVIARGRHEEYVRGERERGVTEPTPAMAPWHDLSPELREANYRYADGVHQILEDIGARLVPLQRGLQGVVELQLSDLAAEYLGIREHNRWWADQCLDGFVWGREKSLATKAHPSMAPWDWLTEADKDRDKASIRVLPRLLAEVGYAVELPPQDAIDARISKAGGIQAARDWRPAKPECAPPPNAGSASDPA